jgi:nitrite reductase/ring-hydroxylating ferredoxin subunit/multimeric flavodoxin WrbA
MTDLKWVDIGAAPDFAACPLTEVALGSARLAISHRDGRFGVVSGVCNHVAGPLGQGCLDGDYIVCPWHNWKFHRVTGLGEPGYEDDAVPCHAVKVENGRLFVSAQPTTLRRKSPHPPHPLARPVQREAGPVRIVGISTTGQDPEHPRYSTSEALLEVALAHAQSKLGCPTRLIKLANLKFRACEGYYSKSAQACTWPCSITMMDDTDELTEVYEALVHWADVVLLATPIRWGQASSLYFKLAERLNCVQNQITLKDRVLISHKVAGFIIMGGQDNIQGVAGQLMSFFTELGFTLPQFPFIAHSRGWTAEDMEQNIVEVQKSEELREGARALVERAVETARMLLAHKARSDQTARGGRKAHRLEVESAEHLRHPASGSPADATTQP